MSQTLDSTPPKSAESRTNASFLIPPDKLDNPWHRFFIRVCGLLGSILFGVFFRWQVEGLENIPAKGPLLLTLNHLSVVDVLATGTALINQGWQPGVNMFTVAKQELLAKPLIPRFMAILGMFPIYRNQVDLNAMRTMLTILRRGALLGIAPEGARSPTGHLQLFQPGVAKLAIQRHIPIIPVGLIGMERVLPIGARLPRFIPITIRFGRVFELAEYYQQELTQEVLERAAWDMRQHVAELLPEWMRELPPEDAIARFGTVRSAAPAPNS